MNGTRWSLGMFAAFLKLTGAPPFSAAINPASYRKVPQPPLSYLSLPHSHLAVVFKCDAGGFERAAHGLHFVGAYRVSSSFKSHDCRVGDPRSVA
jgi:hypothetical protein